MPPKPSQKKGLLAQTNDRRFQNRFIHHGVLHLRSIKDRIKTKTKENTDGVHTASIAADRKDAHLLLQVLAIVRTFSYGAIHKKHEEEIDEVDDFSECKFSPWHVLHWIKEYKDGFKIVFGLKTLQDLYLTPEDRVEIESGQYIFVTSIFYYMKLMSSFNF
jgi:hypothetical protein